MSNHQLPCLAAVVLRVTIILVFVLIDYKTLIFTLAEFEESRFL